MVEYGISQCESKFCVHVGFQVGCIYMFPTSAGQEAVENKLGIVRSANQPGVVYATARGRAVPWRQVRGIEEIRIPEDILTRLSCQRRESTSIKGHKALMVVKELLLRGLLPIELQLGEVKESDLQIKGFDIIVRANLTIQVKCDYRCGTRDLGGTGNVYLQTHELNPLKKF